MSIAKVTVIIPVWNSIQWLPDCLEALAKQSYQEFLLCVVDNGSTDDTREYLKSLLWKNFYLIRFDENKGFAAAVNAGIQYSTTPYVVLLNVDTKPEDKWLETLIKSIEELPVRVTSLASKMLMMDRPDRIDSAGDTFSWYGAATKIGHGFPEKDFDHCRYVFSACAGAALYRRSLFDEIGLFDERYFCYLEDIDIGLREKLKGFQCLYIPKARIHHYGHGSGVNGSFYVYLVTRNRLITIVKNLTLLSLIMHLHKILYGQFYYLIVYKNPLASLRGYMSFLGMVKNIIRSRRDVMRTKTISNKELKKILSNEFAERGLIQIFKSKLK